MITKIQYLIILFALFAAIISSCSKKSTEYDWLVPRPVIEPVSGVYTEPITVTMTCDMKESEIRYTLNGSVPTENSELFTTPFTYSESDSIFIKARAFRFMHDPSETTSAQYTINLNQLPTPIIEPQSGIYKHSIIVNIAANCPATTIRFTTDGNPPHIFAPIYEESFIVRENTIVRAMGFQYGFEPSEINTVEYEFINTAVGWGSNIYGQTDIPPTCDIIDIAAGGLHSLVLRYDGVVIGFGSNSQGQSEAPDENDFISIAAGNYHSLALRKDGSLAGWGMNQYGQSDVPSGNDFVKIAAGHYHSLALKNDGSIVGWGWNLYGQSDVPSGNDYVAISAGSFHSLALRNDGSIIGWGNNGEGQIDNPLDYDYNAIAAGGSHSVALKNDGSIVAWGNNNYGQSDSPDGNDFVKISANVIHNIALRSDGSLVHWGFEGYGMSEVPKGKVFLSISAGRKHNLALSDSYN